MDDIYPSENSKNKKIEQNGLIFLINETSKTAKVVQCTANKQSIVIPRSIQDESKEYILTDISENAFFGCKNKSIQFPPDSELKTIKKRAFAKSSIESIFIPAKLVDLKEGWCRFTHKLTRIEIDPLNPRYSYYDDKFIIGKSTETSENYDVLVFSRRDITEAKIPSFIKSIAPHAFESCNQLRDVIITPDSELKTIEKNAFTYSSIESIFIPASLVDLKEEWCCDIEKLTRIEIDPLNPRYSYYDNKFIIGKSTEISENYDVLVFSRRDITEAKIPSFIKKIGQHAFAFCTQLRSVEIPPDSELRTIENYAFRRTSIESISLPIHFTELCENALLDCVQLQRIEIPPNSELKTIGCDAFSGSIIESIFIPAKLVDLKEGWCCFIPKLTRIEIDPLNPRYSYYDDKFIIGKSTETSENYDVLVFSRRDITEAKIPSFIKKIGPHAFSDCKKIQNHLRCHYTGAAIGSELSKN